MGAREFGQLAKRAAKAKGLSQGRLGYLITDPDGPFFDASQVRLIYQGKRRPTRELVERLIQVLDLPEDEAWHAAGLWPPDLDIEGYRRYRQHALAAAAGTGPDALTHWLGKPQGSVKGLGRLIPFPVGRAA